MGVVEDEFEEASERVDDAADRGGVDPNVF